MACAQQSGGIERGEVFAGNDDAAAIGAFEQVDAADKCAFPGAALSDDAVDFACGDVQVDVAQGVDVLAFMAIGFLQVLQGNHGSVNGERRAIMCACYVAVKRGGAAG